MNCMGPTARSKAVSPSSAPPSVSRIVAVPRCRRGGGRGCGRWWCPRASTRPPEACPDSTRPMPATRSTAGGSRGPRRRARLRRPGRRRAPCSGSRCRRGGRGDGRGRVVREGRSGRRGARRGGSDVDRGRGRRSRPPAYGPNGVPDTDADGWVSATVPTASAGPVCCPKAAKATTDSAPAARPARRCTPGRTFGSRDQHSGAKRDRRPPSECVAPPNAGGSRRGAPDEGGLGTCPHTVTGRRRPSPPSAPPPPHG